MLRLLKKIIEENRYLAREFHDYSSYFGSLFEIIFSPYLHFALLASIVGVCWADDYTQWRAFASSIVPSLLGFSLGGYAILIAFGDNKFREYLATKRVDIRGNSLFVIVNGVFLHFIIVQVVSVACVVVLSLLRVESFFANYVGCVLFFYALSFCVAAAFEIKTISKWYQSFVLCNRKKSLPTRRLRRRYSLLREKRKFNRFN